MFPSLKAKPDSGTELKVVLKRTVPETSSPSLLTWIKTIIPLSSLSAIDILVKRSDKNRTTYPRTKEGPNTQCTFDTFWSGLYGDVEVKRMNRGLTAC